MKGVWDVKKEVDRIKRVVSASLEATAVFLKDDAVRRIVDPPKTGRYYVGAPYRVGKPPHQASAPGESPADDSGALKASGRVEKKSDFHFEVKFGGQGGVDYARDLEYGMPQLKNPLEPRPFLRPAVEEARIKLPKILDLASFYSKTL